MVGDRARGNDGHAARIAILRDARDRPCVGSRARRRKSAAARSADSRRLQSARATHPRRARSTSPCSCRRSRARSETSPRRARRLPRAARGASGTATGRRKLPTSSGSGARKLILRMKARDLQLALEIERGHGGIGLVEELVVVAESRSARADESATWFPRARGPRREDSAAPPRARAADKVGRAALLAHAIANLLAAVRMLANGHSPSPMTAFCNHSRVAAITRSAVSVSGLWAPGEELVFSRQGLVARPSCEWLGGPARLRFSSSAPLLGASCLAFSSVALASALRRFESSCASTRRWGDSLD